MAAKKWTVWVDLLANTKKFTTDMNKAAQRLEKFGLSADKVARRARNMGLVAAGAGTAMTASIISAASAAENYRIRLEAVLGSTEEANRLFKDQAEFAANVAYEYRDIMGAATSLAGVMRGGVDEVNKWMPMITDLATVTGLSVEETTGQIIRMYSAGAASADLFRERGVLAMLGFQAGVSYSAEETRDRLIAAFESPTSKFRDASKKMATTWTGLMSMLSDRWFQFRTMVADAGLFDTAKGAAESFLNYLKEQAESGALQTFARKISDVIVSAVRGLGTVFDVVGTAMSQIEKNPAIVSDGLLGYLLFGVKGAAGFIVMGRALEKIFEQFTGPQDAVERLRMELGFVDREIKRLEEGFYGFNEKSTANLEAARQKAADLRALIEVLTQTENNNAASTFRLSGLFHAMAEAARNAADAANDLTGGGKSGLSGLDGASKAAAESVEDVTYWVEQLHYWQNEGLKMTAAMMTPLEQYNEKMSLLNVMMEQGTITTETYTRAVKQFKDELDNATDSGSTMLEMFEGMADQVAARFVHMGWSIKNFFASIVQTVEETIKRLIASAAVKVFMNLILNILGMGSGSIFRGVGKIFGMDAGGTAGMAANFPSSRDTIPVLARPGERITPAGQPMSNGSTVGGGGITIHSVTYAPMVSTRGDASRFIDEMKRLGVNFA